MLILLALFFVSCEESTSLMSETEYNELLTRLADDSNITKATIDAELQDMGYGDGYIYSTSSSAGNTVHTYTWTSGSSAVAIGVYVDAVGDLVDFQYYMSM